MDSLRQYKPVEAIVVSRTIFSINRLTVFVHQEGVAVRVLDFSRIIHYELLKRGKPTTAEVYSQELKAAIRSNEKKRLLDQQKKG